MEWISEHYELVEFYKFISAQDADKFSNDLIITILQQEKFKTALYVVFIVYLMFMISSDVYLSIYLFQDPIQPKSSFCCLFIVLTSILLAFFEIGTLLNGQSYQAKTAFNF